MKKRGFLTQAAIFVILIIVSTLGFIKIFSIISYQHEKCLVKDRVCLLLTDREADNLWAFNKIHLGAFQLELVEEDNTIIVTKNIQTFIFKSADLVRAKLKPEDK